MLRLLILNANKDIIQLTGLSSFYSIFENSVSGIVSIDLDKGNGAFDAGDDLIASVNISPGNFDLANNLTFA